MAELKDKVIVFVLAPPSRRPLVGVAGHREKGKGSRDSETQRRQIPCRHLRRNLEGEGHSRHITESLDSRSQDISLCHACQGFLGPAVPMPSCLKQRMKFNYFSISIPVSSSARSNLEIGLWPAFLSSCLLKRDVFGCLLGLAALPDSRELWRNQEF